MSIEETIRLVVREEIRAAMREFATAVQSRPGGDPDEQLSKAKAASIAGVSISTIDRWITTGALAIRKVGVEPVHAPSTEPRVDRRPIRIRRGDLDALLSRQVVQGGEVDADALADQVLARRKQ